MNHFLTTTFVVLLLASGLLASPPSYKEQNAGYKPLAYDGPKEEPLWSLIDKRSRKHMRFQEAEESYAIAIRNTTLGRLAHKSDIIGVGRVVNEEEDHFTVEVDHALFGCTNGASIVIYRSTHFSTYPEYLPEYDPPVNNKQIVFAAYKKVFFYMDGKIIRGFDTKVPEITEKKHLALLDSNRSWWPVERDNGLLYEQFTNILQAVRFDRNWTNYYYLCRNAAISPSNRVREDGFADMRSLVVDFTFIPKLEDERFPPEMRRLVFDFMFIPSPEHERFMDEDPLVDPKHKALLFGRHGQIPVADSDKAKYLAALAKLKGETQWRKFIKAGGLALVCLAGVVAVIMLQRRRRYLILPKEP